MSKPTLVEELQMLVQRSSMAMQIRLIEKHKQGRRGWKTEIDDLLNRLDKAHARKDFLDAAILNFMLYDFQQRNSQKYVIGAKQQTGRGGAS